MEELLSIRADSLERFLTRWYGPPRGEPQTTDTLAGMPAPLAQLHRLLSGWDRPLFVQNHLPTSLTRDQDKVVFYVENQGVWLWGFEPGAADPAVWDRENQPDRAWQPTGESLSTFLLHAAVFEAILGAAVGAVAIDMNRDQMDQALGPMRPAPLPAWRWPGPETRIYCNDKLLAFAGVNAKPGSPVGPESRYEIYVAANDAEDLAYLDSLPIEWEQNSRVWPKAAQ